MAGNKLGPRGRAGKPVVGNQITTTLPLEQLSFDKSAFDVAVRSQGIRLRHFRAIPDPRGMMSRGDTHDTMGIRDSSDQFIYKDAGVLTGLFQNNSANSNLAQESVLDVSSAYITLPTTYDDNADPVIVQDWDRFFLEDIEVRVGTKQFIEASLTGIDRLQYPATCIEHVVDRNGVEYREGKDYAIDPDGNIRWLTANRPGTDPQTGRGIVYAVRYRYTPFFVVDRLIHEIRVSQITDPTTFDRKLERMPYQVLALREKVFKDRNRTEADARPDQRFQDAPAPGGSMGPSPTGKLGVIPGKPYSQQ